MQKNVWDGNFSSLRICPNTHPALHASLSCLTARQRAERLKSLAMVGLAMEKIGIGAIATGQGVAAPEQPAKPRQDNRLLSVGGKMLGSMG